MMNRIALISSFAVLSAVAFVPKASAAPTTQDIDFTGTVVSTCAFSGITSGTIVQPSPTNGWLESSAGTGGTAGTAGQANVVCNAGGTLAVSVPTGSGPAGFSPAVLESVVTDGTNYTSANTGGNFDTGLWNKPTAALTIPAGSTGSNLKVGMIVGSKTGSPVPAGSYSYKVTLTATSN